VSANRFARPRYAVFRHLRAEFYFEIGRQIEVIEGGVVACLRVLELTFDVLRLLIQRDLVLSHRGVEVFDDLGPISPLICLAAGAASRKADGQYSNNGD